MSPLHCIFAHVKNPMMLGLLVYGNNKWLSEVDIKEKLLCNSEACKLNTGLWPVLVLVLVLVVPEQNWRQSAALRKLGIDFLLNNFFHLKAEHFFN